jgi:hypothetical protein
LACHAQIARIETQAAEIAERPLRMSHDSGGRGRVQLLNDWDAEVTKKAKTDVRAPLSPVRRSLRAAVQLLNAET